MSPEPEIVVIIPVRNGAQTIGEQLTALVHQDWEGSWEVAVVDNGSTDHTAEVVGEFLRRYPGRIRVLRAPDRHNLSYVRNTGARLTSSRSVIFCDADDVVGVGWLRAMARALETSELVGSRLDYTVLNEPSHGSRQSYQIARVGELFGVPVISGCGMGCGRELWERLDGNDEQVLAEDTDFSIRAHLHAGVIPVLAEAVYHYRLRRNPRSELRRAIRQARSEVQLFKRYGSEPYRPSALRVAQTWIRACASLRHLGTADERLVAARLWGGVLGRLAGSIAYRTRYL